MYTLLHFSTHSAICNAGSLDPRKVKGKILVCLREYNDNARTKKSQQADIAGAVGMILVNDEQSGNDVVADPHACAPCFTSQLHRRQTCFWLH